MSGGVEEYDEQSRLRISDADRHRVSEFLRESAGEGRLDLEELDQRLEAAYSAKVYADLVPIVADLPGRPGLEQRSARVPSGAIRFDSSFAMMSGLQRLGAWEPGPTHQAVALMGGIDIDLREAVLTAPETVIRAVAVMGGINVWVNARTRLVVDGIGIMGGFSQSRDRVEAEISADSPVVRVTGLALMGGVDVRRKKMPRER